VDHLAQADFASFLSLRCARPPVNHSKLEGAAMINMEINFAFRNQAAFIPFPITFSSKNSSDL